MSDKTLQKTEEVTHKNTLLHKIASDDYPLWILAYVLYGTGKYFDIPILLPISIMLISIAFTAIIYTIVQHFKAPGKKSVPWKLIYRLTLSILLFLIIYYTI